MSKRCMGCMGEYDEGLAKCPLCGYERESEAKEAYHLPPGSVIGDRYMLGRVLGFGGFGVTYIGFDETLGIRVAVKEYLPGEFATRIPGQKKVTIYTGEGEEQFAAGEKQFLDEARRLAAFQDKKGIVNVYDSFEENDTAYIIMEYLEGESLKERLKRVGKLPLHEALDILNQILDALELIHAEGMIHRDIAPDNVYLEKDGAVKLLDFGAARFATTRHSRSLTIMVKSGYSPEEQYQSHGNQGPWTDIYAAAATFYRMVTGTAPEDSMERTLKDTVKPPSRMGIKLPKPIDTAVMNALNVKAEDRTKSAAEFKKELEASSVAVKRSTLKKQDTAKWPLWLKAAAVLGFAAAGIFLALLFTDVIRFDITGRGQMSVTEGESRVPNFTNMTQEDAKASAEAAGLSLRVYDKEYSDIIPEGRIMEQDIAAGQLVDTGTVIRVTLSAGIEKTFVPDVVGMTEDKARELLLEAGFKIRVEEETGEMAPGAVEKQSLPAYQVTESGSEILLTVSTGTGEEARDVEGELGELSGEDFLTAARRLYSQYQVYLIKEETEYSDEVPEGEILSQAAAAGTKVHPFDQISVTVSSGKERHILEDMSYKTVEEARRILESASFTVTEEHVYSGETEAGHVISQTPQASQLAEKGQEITLTVSDGPEPAVNNPPTPQNQNQGAQRQNRDTGQQGRQAGQNQAPAQPEAPPQENQQPAQPEAPPVQQQPPVQQEAPPADDIAPEDLNGRLGNLGI